MKRLLLPALLAFGLLTYTPATFGADAKAELQELVGKVKAKLSGGHKTEADLADELKGFDTLLAEHKGEKTEDVAQILSMKALLYAEVLDDDDKATELLKQVQTDYPDTAASKQAAQIVASIAQQSESKKLRKGLVAGAAFPEFEGQDLEGKPLSVASRKGKVVLIDFWATWCGPCVAELPNVLAAYKKYHDKGFEIIGISLDKDHDKLTSFIKEKDVTWPQYFDGQGWQNKVSTKYGINSIPATFLLDKDGKIIASDLRGEALDAALGKALN
jgi:thiol-disulfide isomerase/thioredoxin